MSFPRAHVLPRVAGKAQATRPSWWPVFYSAQGSAILFSCPNGHASQWYVHQFSPDPDDGTVPVRVRCSRYLSGCDFRGYVRFLDWDPTLVPRRLDYYD